MVKSKKRLLCVFTIVILTGLFFYIMNYKAVVANILINRTIPSFDYPGQRILVVAPHPDDEALGAGGVIREAVKNNIPVKVVIFTSGESNKKAAYFNSKRLNLKPNDFLNLGVARQDESIKAMNVLGLNRKNVIFLGFADGSTRFLWDNYWDRPRVSGSTLVDFCPYKSNVVSPDISYEGENVVDLFQSILKDYKPTDIYYPDPNDEHPDHWAVSNFVKYSLLTKNDHIREHTYLVHHPQWPVPWLARPNLNEKPPTDLKGENWEYFNLTRDDIKYKTQALLKYTSQLKVMQPFMVGFIRKSELFGYVPKISVRNVDELPKSTNEYIVAKATFGQLNQEIYTSADIKNMSVYKYKDKLYVGINTVSPVVKNVDYQLGIRIFYKNSDVKRIDVGVINNKQIIYSRAYNSITDKDISTLKISKNNILYQVSIPDEKNVRDIFMGSQALHNGNLISRIPWYVYTLTPQE